MKNLLIAICFIALVTSCNQSRKDEDLGSKYVLRQKIDSIISIDTNCFNNEVMAVQFVDKLNSLLRKGIGDSAILLKNIPFTLSSIQDYSRELNEKYGKIKEVNDSVYVAKLDYTGSLFSDKYNIILTVYTIINPKDISTLKNNKSYKLEGTYLGPLSKTAKIDISGPSECADLYLESLLIKDSKLTPYKRKHTRKK